MADAMTPRGRRDQAAWQTALTAEAKRKVQRQVAFVDGLVSLFEDEAAERPGPRPLMAEQFMIQRARTVLRVSERRPELTVGEAIAVADVEFLDEMLRIAAQKPELEPEISALLAWMGWRVTPPLPPLSAA